MGQLHLSIHYHRAGHSITIVFSKLIMYNILPDITK